MVEALLVSPAEIDRQINNFVPGKRSYIELFLEKAEELRQSEAGTDVVHYFAYVTGEFLWKRFPDDGPINRDNRLKLWNLVDARFPGIGSMRLGPAIDLLSREIADGQRA